MEIKKLSTLSLVGGCVRNLSLVCSDHINVESVGQVNVNFPYKTKHEVGYENMKPKACIDELLNSIETCVDSTSEITAKSLKTRTVIFL